MRAFIGIKFDSILDDLESLINELKIKYPMLKYTNKENLHLTLEFLGNISDNDINKITQIFNKVSFNSFELVIDEITNFRDLIILTFKENNYLIELQKQLRKLLKENGFMINDRKFFPHITLARRVDIIIKEKIRFKFEVNEIILFSSNRINNKLIYKSILRKTIK